MLTQQETPAKRRDRWVMTPQTLKRDRLIIQTLTGRSRASGLRQRLNRLLPIMLGTLHSVRYRVIIYTGFMYDAKGLIGSSILTSNAGMLYSKNYDFSTTDVDLLALVDLGGTQDDCTLVAHSLTLLF